MEDYEKKYKQLHKFITDLYPHMSEYCKEKVEGFFPELAESKEERIRKEIISFLHSKNGYMNPDEDWDFHNRWLPFLSAGKSADRPGNEIMFPGSFSCSAGRDPPD